MAIIAPSILSADFYELGKQVEQVERGGAGLLHFDVMDGVFVPNISFGAPVLRSLVGKTSLRFDVHLMVEEPGKLIPDFINPGTEYIVIHQEACLHLHRTIQQIKQVGIKAGVAIDPGTPVSVLDCVLEDVDLVLVMGVNPGFGGQRFISQSRRKVEQLDRIRREEGLDFRIELDGGVTMENALGIRQAGADIIVAGSAIFSQPDIEAATRRFAQLLE